MHDHANNACPINADPRNESCACQPAPRILPRRIQTNEDFVRHLMNYSPAGALCQAFIVQAIREFADAVAKAGPVAVDTPMVNGKAWHRCATHIQACMAEFYGR